MYDRSDREIEIQQEDYLKVHLHLQLCQQVVEKKHIFQKNLKKRKLNKKSNY